MSSSAGTSIATGARKKVVIVGGGCGGVATAFYLTATPALRARFDVTLYTRGWRLGGKGASGRNQQFGRRIEEHGLHVWLGFYQYAFQLIRAAYLEWTPAPDCPFPHWTDAFTPEQGVVLEQADDGVWDPWVLDFPVRPGTPGDDGTMSVEQLVRAGVTLLQTRFDELDPILGPIVDHAHTLDLVIRVLDNVLDGVARTLAVTALNGLQLVLLAQHKSIEATENFSGATSVPLGGPPRPSTVRRLLVLVNFGVTMLIGYLLDILPFDATNNHQAAYDALDAKEFRAWLSEHGAWTETIDSSLIKWLYDSTFAYRDGDASSPDNGVLACGVTLRLLESGVFGYRGAPVWKMNAGMGDTIFTPLYEVLVARGVCIRFFHALTDVVPSEDGSRIEYLTFNRQADLIAAPYKPLVNVAGLGCWPSQPDWCQLVGGATLQSAGADFESIWDHTSAGTVNLTIDAGDCVVLAIPPEMLKYSAAKLRANARWSAMLDNSASVATQAFQLWLSTPTGNLGVPFEVAPLTCFAEPFDTWCDMSHLLPREGWDPQAKPAAISYFCGAMHVPLLGPGDPDPRAQRQAQVEGETAAWLKSNIRILWPDVVAADGGLRDGLVVSSYARANFDPSDLYVLVPPGSVQHRLAPDSCLFANLFLAGDWTRMPASGGCVENAVQSGLTAAQAISGITITLNK